MKKDPKIQDPTGPGQAISPAWQHQVMARQIMHRDFDLELSAELAKSALETGATWTEEDWLVWDELDQSLDAERSR